MNGWNRMQERKPTECKHYLVITKWNGYQVCLWFGGEWCWKDHTYVVDDISWWRELPEPPKGVGENA